MYTDVFIFGLPLNAFITPVVLLPARLLHIGEQFQLNTTYFNIKQNLGLTLFHCSRNMGITAVVGQVKVK